MRELQFLKQCLVARLRPHGIKEGIAVEVNHPSAAYLEGALGDIQNFLFLAE
jgi:hypothetical protein